MLGESGNRLPHGEKEDFAVSKTILRAAILGLLVVGLMASTVFAGDEGFKMNISSARTTMVEGR